MLKIDLFGINSAAERRQQNKSFQSIDKMEVCVHYVFIMEGGLLWEKRAKEMRLTAGTGTLPTTAHLQ